MTYTIASFSGGKDSTAMVLRMLEIGEPLDEVIYCDTGMEFPAMVEHIKKVSRYVRMYGVRFTVLRSRYTFDYMLMDKPVRSAKHGDHNGLGWPSQMMRWCTGYLKRDVVRPYLRSIDSDYMQCIGFAYDEQRRMKQDARERYPLVEWGWTEKQCLEYCYDKGFDWYDSSNGKRLYDLFHRTSCWICPLSSMDNFRNLRRHYPALWESIGERERILRERFPDKPIFYSYTPKYTWEQLEERFAKEDEDVSRSS